MGFMLYETETGKPLSQSSIEPINIPSGTSVKEFENFVGSWNAETLSFDPLPVKKKIPTLSFMELFTDAELIIILDAAKVSTQIQLFVMKIEQASFIDLNYQPMIDGINALVSVGLLTAERAKAVLNG
jgi:hypothetical protein